MHMALTIPDLGGGGAERSVLNIAQGLIGRGHRVDLVLYRPRIHYPSEIPEAARLFTVDDRPDEVTRRSAGHLLENLIQLPSRWKLFDWIGIMNAFKWDPRLAPSARTVRYARALVEYVNRERPDCVLPSLPGAKVAALLACRLLVHPPPVVPILRNNIGARRRRYRRQYRHLFRHASRIVCVSQGVADSLVEGLGVPEAKVSTIYNPVVTADLVVRMAQPAKHPWMGEGRIPVILSAGRLVSVKDYSTLIHAFARVAGQRPCRLIILGEGRLRGPLERLVASLGLADCVSLPGWVDNPFAFMSRAALFVLSSRYEGLPGVLIQALACGCPCVSTDCPSGPAEVLQGGRLGPLVPVGDAVRLAEAMTAVLDQPPDGKTLREGAAVFSADRSALAYERLIASVIRSH